MSGLETCEYSKPLEFLRLACVTAGKNSILFNGWQNKFRLPYLARNVDLISSNKKYTTSRRNKCMMKRYLFMGSALIAMATLTLMAPLQAVAQDDEAVWTQVRTHHLRTGGSGAFAELMKEFNAGAKAADRPVLAVFQEVRGDVGVFHTLTRVASLAEYDTPFDPPMSDGEWADWLSRYQDVVESSTLTQLRRHPELGISSDDGDPGNLVYLRYRTVASGKSGAYAEWLESQLIPHLKMGGVKNRTQSRVRMGGNNNTWISATSFASWAEMEESAPLAHMGEDARGTMMSTGNALLVDSEDRVLQFRADLSE
jgi:hypothetical protein